MGNTQNSGNKPNSLVNETSPYLLQHAYNPVEWYGWNQDALEKSKKEDKPIFLSIGYSSCHWCHVMAHESFEDNEIAKIMNEHFINIKVDREERPDIDDIYQRACQMYTGTGGWPLSAFLTPEQRPFYIGTYFPKENRHGLPGFGTILLRLADGYKNKRNEVISSSQEFVTALWKSSSDIVSDTDTKVEKTIINEAAVTLLQLADNLYGGFGSAPKFPNASNLLFLLRAYDYSGITKYRDFVKFTADKMDSGGIHDHVGGGFARYSTDQRWLVPHFEKMLYDNALLGRAYLETFQVTGNDSYSQVVTEVLDYVLREMTDDQGAFYSATDADSEGEEGKFFVWTPEQVAQALDNEEDCRRFCAVYDITKQGNWEHKNIPNRMRPLDVIAQELQVPIEALRDSVRRGRALLYEARARRVPPGLDDKIITAWNGMMISAMAEAGRVLDRPEYIEAARRSAEYLLRMHYT